LTRELFVKMVTDANKMNAFYMDDYTAGLLFDNFSDMEFDELNWILNKLKREGEKVTYKSLLLNRKEKKKTVTKEKETTVIYECEENCTECTRHDVACVKFNKECSKVMQKILNGDITYEEGRKFLHSIYPNVGFDKKIGTCVGVIWNEDGEHTPVYKYD
jgi:hypothetical protein